MRLGSVWEILNVNMTVNVFSVFQKFKYSKSNIFWIFTLFLNISSVWCRKSIQGDPVALKTPKIMSLRLLHAKWGQFNDITLTTGSCIKSSTRRTFTQWYGTHKWITPVTPEFSFLMQRHAIRHVPLTETRDIEQKCVFRSLLSLYGAWFLTGWGKNVQDVIIWSRLVLKAIALWSKCQTTHLLMDPDDILWVLNP